MSNTMTELPDILVMNAVAVALQEDFANAGDVTTRLTISPETLSSCAIHAREEGLLSGMQLAREAFRQVSEEVVFHALASDGDPLEPGQKVAEIEGKAQAILSGERVALNFLGHMSGIATLTGRFAGKVEGTGARICCTRKTTPGLRGVEKYAVRCGGGVNHRFGLYDAVLIKDNHIAIAGGIERILESLGKAGKGHMMKVEIEVDTLDQLRQLEPALGTSVHAVLLDNMPPDVLKEAVAFIDGRVIAEASGGVNLETVREIAKSGVDLISVGALTHSAPTLDLGLDYNV